MKGTDGYRDAEGLPELVLRAVELARAIGFAQSCRVEQGRLLNHGQPDTARTG